MLLPSQATWISQLFWTFLTPHLCFQVQNLEKLQDFGECVITLQESVIKKFLQGFMAPKQKKKKKTGGEESTTAEEVDDQKRLAEEARVSVLVLNRVSWYFISVIDFMILNNIAKNIYKTNYYI